MFSITFTKAQAEQFIHGIFQKNFRGNPEFIVRISDEECDNRIQDYMKAISSGSELKADTKDEVKENPWLTPDEDGWFTHDPEYSSVGEPLYINTDRLIHIKYRCGEHEHEVLASECNWSQDNNPYDIIKWKYA